MRSGNAIIQTMVKQDTGSRHILKTGSGADLAFAIVVMASYFATFSSFKDISVVKIILLIGLGVAYLTTGIYGYAYCARSKSVFWQLIYFAIQIPLGGAIVYLGQGVSYNAMILLPLAAHSVVMLSQGWMIVVNGIVLMVYILSTALFSPDWTSVWSSLPTFLAGQVFIVFFTQLAVSEEKARLQINQLVSELAEANQRLRSYAVQIEELTIAKERNRLAREIHDGIGHYLTTIHMQLQAAKAVLPGRLDLAKEAIDKAQHLTQEALADVRKSVAALRAPLDERIPLTDRLRKLLEGMEVSGIHTELQVVGEEQALSPQVDLTLYRAVQESLSNTIKHAQASNFKVTLDFEQPGMVGLVVEDNGIGADTTNGGFGLIGIQERVNLLNGNFWIESNKGKGFQIRLEVPL